MTIIRTIIAALCCLGAGFGQAVETDGADRFGVPAALQEVLNLTDTQVDQLREFNRAMADETRPIGREIQDLRRDLRRETRSDTPNETIVGTITMDIENREEQVQTIRDNYQTMARGVLSADQIAALAPIEQAAEHVYTVMQAARYNLVSVPAPEGRDGGRIQGNDARQQQRSRR